ncbi:MAG: PEP-CTERM sorting domain-containing protein [Sedimentisphaerales bacterium]|nr:PEP-CTERM sorting domain-containing protein [Sedimentisphaerales bacterium]
MRYYPICAVVLSLLALPVQAMVACPDVENYSFELPGTGKMNNWENVPGWSSDTVAVDSGVESDWPGSTDGVWAGYLYNNDPSVWQLTYISIEADKLYKLSLDARNNWSQAGAADLMVSLYYDNAGARTTVASQTFHLAGEWEPLSVSFLSNDAAESLGNRLGIELQNVTAPDSGGSWLGIDTVCIATVPEPMTVALLGLGSLFLRRRK